MASMLSSRHILPRRWFFWDSCFLAATLVFFAASLSLPLIYVPLELLLSYVIYWILRGVYVRIHWAQLRQQLPGPKPKNLLVGAITQLDPKQVLEQTERWAQEFGPVFFVEGLFGFAPGVWISDAGSIKELLLAPNMPKGVSNNVLRKWLGLGLVTSYGDVWKAHRSLITPAFHLEMISSFASAFQQSGQRLVDHWTKTRIHADNTQDFFDVWEDVSRVLFDAIGITAFNHDFDALINNRDCEYLKHTTNMLFLVVEKTTNPILQIDWLYPFTSSGKLWATSSEATNALPIRLIQERRAYLREHGIEAVKKKKNRTSFVDLLLMSKYEDGEGISDDDILDETKTFLVAGHDTVTSAVCFLAWCLASHPEKQARLHEEITGVLADSDHDVPTVEEMRSKMPYLESAVKESLRLYASGPITSRCPDVPITVNGVTLPPYTDVKIMHFAVSRSEAYWKEPLQYRPERWHEDKITSFAYVPFSAGQRSCIGQSYALLEIKIMICMILKNFQLIADPNHTPKLRARVALTSENGIRLRLLPRT